MQIVVDHENGQVWAANGVWAAKNGVWAAKLESYLEHHQISMMKCFAKTINDI